MRVAARAARLPSLTPESNSLSIKNRLDPCEGVIRTIPEALGWSRKNSRGVAKMKSRMSATTTSYGQEARGKSQKTRRRAKLTLPASWLRPCTTRSLASGSVLSHNGQDASLNLEILRFHVDWTHGCVCGLQPDLTVR